MLISDGTYALVGSLSASREPFQELALTGVISSVPAHEQAALDQAGYAQQSRSHGERGASCNVDSFVCLSLPLIGEGW